MGKIRASEVCFLLRTQHPVDRVARDGVLSEKETQLCRMFLYVAQRVQQEFEIAQRHASGPLKSVQLVCLLL